MATDYDAPRTRDGEESAEESLEAIQPRASAPTQTSIIDAAEGIDLPGADLSHEELTVAVVSEQADEFTCGSCFLVRHRSQIARQDDGAGYCAECEG